MIASRIGRADTRFGPTRFGGSSSAMIGSTSDHSSSGTRQIGGSGSRSFLGLSILHPVLSRRCRPGASLEIGTKALDGEMLVAPFNDLETTTRLIAEHAGELAAVVLEPLQRCVVPTYGFLDGVLRVAREHRN